MSESLVVVTIPGLRVQNPLNSSHGHWSAAAKRGRDEVAVTRLALSQLGTAVRDRLRGTPRVRVTLVRLCKREFDDDGLAAGFKHVRDAVGDWLRPGLPPGHADAKKHGLTFSCKQETGHPGYGVRVEFTAEPGEE